MKKILPVLALILSTAVVAQNAGGAPEAAKAAFSKAHPGATKVKWEKEDGNYEVAFALNGREASAIYNAKGFLVESEQEIKVTELPAAIITYMKNNYKGITVKSAAKITKADGAVNYEAAIKGKDVLFDAHGKFLREAKD